MASSSKLDRVRVMLRTELFSTGGPDAHVPPNVAIVDGRVLDQTGGLLIEVGAVYNGGGKRLDCHPCTIWLPSGKIDHVLMLEA